MKERGIRPKRGKRRVPIATDSRHFHRIAPDRLERDVTASEPDTV
ncbi:MAG: hypothetical protein AAGA15_15130 [Pseudomonadota bacterium]